MVYLIVRIHHSGERTTDLETAQQTAVEARAELMKERTKFDFVEEKLYRE